MGRFASRLNGRVLAGLQDFSPAERQVVLRGSWRGPVPSDPRQRAAAISVVERRRDLDLRTRGRSVGIFATGVVLYVVLALTRSWWWWPCAVLFLGFLLLTLVHRRRLDRRLEVLRNGGEDEPRLDPDGSWSGEPGE